MGSTKEFSVLVIDDDVDFLKGLVRNLKKQFVDTEILHRSAAEQAVELLAQKEIGVMLTDLRMPGMSGHELLQKALEINPRICAIMITGHATIESAVKALKIGAWDFITKPVEREALYHTVEKALEHYALARENKRLQSLVDRLKRDASVQWESLAMKQLQEKISAIAATDYTVLITGESGSGKEYIANTIHRMSKRSDASCHALNCPAIPEQLLESELFGHVKGAFTGADRSREGFFMAANHGTLILDEIGDISPAIQAKLLKFLQDKEVKPVGSSNSRTADVRIIALTNQDLEKKITDNQFRSDLFYRLNVLSLHVPPLRERKEDIPVLTREFLMITCKEMDFEPVEIQPAVLSYLAAQPWPGNVRELLNFVRRLVVFSNGQTIDMGLVGLIEQKPGSPESQPEGVTLYKDAKKKALDLFSERYLTSLFEHTRGNISKASRISGLERASIQKIIRRLGMDMSLFRDH
ncbi:MAG: sigma-54-dependent Fis family transcriptional regulator [Desulfobacteraceae bacterium]|nr:MAG: sigma-54-dependent Fis family transcriptional regulator [Desulfobacteraceae bacterium]